MSTDTNLHLFELKVLGVRLMLKHDGDSSAHLKEAETMLRHQLELTQQFSRAKEPLNVAIITAFRLVSDLMTERSERAMLPSISMAEGAEIEKLVQEMLESLENLVSEPAAPFRPGGDRQIN